MFKLLSKSILALSAIFSLGTLSAWDNYNCCEQPSCCEPSGRLYIGAFGGGIYSNSSQFSQFGTAFFLEPPTSIGPLPIIGEGHLNKTSAGFGGVQLGYEWAQRGCSGWGIAPAAELEAFFFRHSKHGHLINQTVVGLPEHDFLDSFRVNSSVILGNVVFALYNDCLCGITPYVGGGIGATRLSLSNANSLQVSPVEAGVNHFNSRTSDSDWTFAAQIKVGLRYNFCKCFHVFGEYRYLWVDSSNYVFGSTNYPTHVPTSPWNVRIKNASYNAFTIGIQYDL